MPTEQEHSTPNLGYLLDTRFIALPASPPLVHKKAADLIAAPVERPFKPAAKAGRVPHDVRMKRLQPGVQVACPPRLARAPDELHILLRNRIASPSPLGCGLSARSARPPRP